MAGHQPTRSATVDNPELQDTQFSAGTAVASNYGATADVDASELAASKPTTGSARVLAPDLLRGLLMALMSLDHAAIFMGAWRHGTPKESESDSTVFVEWNHTVAYISRTLTHLCAPGFFFLMGMGTVYFARSRTNLGWSTWQMSRHFVVRGIALALVNEVMSLTFFARRGFWIVNIVLLGLAIDYVLSGLLCLAVNASESFLARMIVPKSQQAQQDASATTPLLSSSSSNNTRRQAQPHAPSAANSSSSSSSHKSRAQTISFWIHNLLLLALTGVTIFWNVWLSPHHGQCVASGGQAASAVSVESQLLSGFWPSSEPQVHTSLLLLLLLPRPEHSSRGAWFDFWFYPVQTSTVMSGFPPLAWLSFCILGILYARVVLARRFPPATLVTANLAVAVLLSALFVATRLAHFGNLSEGCLRMPEQLAHPNANQYLVSVKSFFFITKYPPSPSFFFFTLACNFYLLALFGMLSAGTASRLPGLLNFGGSALFFYVVHMYLYTALSIPVKRLFAHPLPSRDQPPGGNDWESSTGTGISPAFWLTWLLGLAILSPVCGAYARFKATKPSDSLWRFF
ncbi:hypothetical protein BCV70DRAFT_200799 [Testicularia cyperi]|uniref:Heparan-alpha-glucosaminide N-acetyltransferase catalytic domain-containing protein n=1 Tax=Testicularia cyperi TaxID=1882483 RepID=A0A317XRG5_9BASI|nr:hypothetical protein BCV70DRAFT_200799 [Testicularia cyperi]